MTQYKVTLTWCQITRDIFEPVKSQKVMFLISKVLIRIMFEKNTYQKVKELI